MRAIVIVLTAVAVIPLAAGCQIGNGASEPRLDSTAMVGRGWVRESNGDTAGAIADFTKAIAQDPTDAKAYLSRGMAADLAGDDVHAIPDLDLAGRVGPDPLPYAAVWLMLASRRMHNDYGGELSASSQWEEYGAWPGPIMRFLERVISEDALLKAALGSTLAVAEKQGCEATFYIGEVDHIDGRPDAARRRFEQVRDNCSQSLPEFAAALAELKRG